MSSTFGGGNEIFRTMNKGYAVVIICSLLLVSMHAFIDRSKTVVFHSRGFFPRAVTIRQGESVSFISKTGKSFWPASNIHPGHGLYPEFDPQEPVTVWQFTFNTPGKWRFHDHISPEFTGIVTVKGEIDPPCEKQQCWDEALSSALDQKGIQGAFAEFLKLYKTDAEFVTSGCHVHAHRIGDVYYEVYASKLKTLQGIELPVETMACGYGFFHGLFEHFFRKYPNIALVRDICDDLDARYGRSIPLIRINCFHGAGHGLIADPPDPARWGKPQELISQPLSLCDAISPNPSETYACADGIFNVVSSWMGDEKYGMKIDTINPFWLCSSLAPKYQESCYYEQIMVMTEFEHRDMVAIAKKYIVPIQDRGIAQRTMFSLAAAFLQKDVVLPSHTHLLQACRQMPQYLQRGCIEGVVNGFIAHGEPGKEKEKASAFCNDRAMTAVEQRICFDYLQ